MPEKTKTYISITPHLYRALPVMIVTSVFATSAFAQDIDSETTEPVRTSTSADGQAGDIVITEDGAIILSDTPGQTAITVDSNNNVTLDGSIESEDTNDITAIRIEPGFTGDIRGSGDILLTEDYTREDNDDDDDLDGPLAVGENRIGLELVSGGTHRGDIVFESGNAITVEGNNSAGILLGSTLDGNFSTDGAISVIGDNAIGFEADNGITGDVLFSGSLVTQGSDARGVSLDGDIGGNVTVEGLITTTGFTNPSATNYIAPSLVDEDTEPVDTRIDAEDLNAAGPAFAIGGSLAQGFLINGNVDDFISDEDSEDETKDTIEDYDENRSAGSITSTGSSPAVLITPDLDGAATSDITLGTVRETVRDTLDDDEDEDFTETLATFDYAYGLINRGTITGNGQNIGYAATGLAMRGSADGNFTTQIEGGVFNSGTIRATAYEENADAVWLGDGSSVPTIDNNGSILATTNTTDGHSATGLHIQSGATLTGVTNNGSIQAQSNGDSGNAYAIRDLSGTLTDITNTGTISASIAENGLAETDLGRAVAIDLSQSTEDITFLQRRVTPTEDKNGDDEIDADDERTPALIGDVIFGSGDDSYTVAGGSVIGDTEFGAGDADVSLRSMTYTGDMTFSDGDTRYSAINTTVTGDLSFGGASAALYLEDSIFEGDIFSSGGLNDVTIIDSELLLTMETAAQFDALSITGDSVFQVELDPRLSSNAASFTVAGAAVIGDNVTIRPILDTITSSDFTHTFIRANTLDFSGVLDDALVEDAPFIYNVDLSVTDADTDSLELKFTLKSAQELGLDSNQAAAYAAVLDVFSSDDDLGTALAALTEADEFYQVYNLLLPQRTEASTRYLSAQNSAAFGALANRLDAVALTGETGTGLWAEEFYTQVDIDTALNVPGYNGDGFGFSLGIDRKLSFIDIIGAYLNYSSGEFEEKTGGRNPVTTDSLGLGLYAKDSFGPIDLVLSGQFSRVNFFSTRALTLDDLPYEMEGDWDGTSAALSAGISSRFERNRLYARPSVSLDYFQLSQDAYTETGDDRLAASVTAADTDRLTATAALDVGVDFTSGRSQQVVWSPALSLGVRSELSATGYEADIQYLGSDESFTITSQETYSDALLAGVSLSTQSSLLTARFGYDVEVADEGLVHYGGATVKLRF